LKDLKINRTPKTPHVNFDLASGVFLISGVSVPENSMKFYDEIIRWSKDYVKSPTDKTKLVFKLTYVNTSSLQFIYDLLIILGDIHKKSSEISIEWHYMNDDIDMKEMGEDFEDAINIKINFVCVDDV
jgi:SiaC family regulatory phosphoprotein